MGSRIKSVNDVHVFCADACQVVYNINVLRGDNPAKGEDVGLRLPQHEAGRPGPLQTKPILHLPLQVAGVLMKIGDLVRITSGTKHHGSLGVIVDTRPRFLDPRSEELLMTVLYTDGNEGGWSEYNLEVVNESR